MILIPSRPVPFRCVALRFFRLHCFAKPLREWVSKEQFVSARTRAHYVRKRWDLWRCLTLPFSRSPCLSLKALEGAITCLRKTLFFRGSETPLPAEIFIFRNSSLITASTTSTFVGKVNRREARFLAENQARYAFLATFISSTPSPHEESIKKLSPKSSEKFEYPMRGLWAQV